MQENLKSRPEPRTDTAQNLVRPPQTPASMFPHHKVKGMQSLSPEPDISPTASVRGWQKLAGPEFRPDTGLMCLSLPSFITKHIFNAVQDGALSS